MLKRFYLEITNACNLDCPFCTNPKHREFISLDNFKIAISQIKKYSSYIYLHILGEPLLHPFFNEILDILDEEDMKLQLVTNGTLLKKCDLDKHPSLRKLSISLHSQYKDDEQYFKTIDELLTKEHSYILDLRFYNLATLTKPALNYLNDLKSRYDFKPSKVPNQYKIKDKVYVTTNPFFKWPDIDDKIHNIKGTCLGAKTMLAILVNGDVTLCCLDTKGINKLGNIYLDGLDNIINSKEYKKVVTDLNNNQLTMPLCQRCSYHDRFDTNI